jgi:hypothetical protein
MDNSDSKVMVTSDDGKMEELVDVETPTGERAAVNFGPGYNPSHMDAMKHPADAKPLTKGELANALVGAGADRRALTKSELANALVGAGADRRAVDLLATAAYNLIVGNNGLGPDLPSVPSVPPLSHAGTDDEGLEESKRIMAMAGLGSPAGMTQVAAADAARAMAAAEMSAYEAMQAVAAMLVGDSKYKLEVLRQILVAAFLQGSRWGCQAALNVICGIV